MQINGSMGILYVLDLLFGIMTIVLLMGKGSWMIAGYNTASQEEKEKYNARKMCRVVGCCMGIIEILLLIMTFFEECLPEIFANISFVIILLDVVVTVILCNTICKK